MYEFQKLIYIENQALTNQFKNNYPTKSVEE